jgi:hypothetical protein
MVIAERFVAHYNILIGLICIQVTGLRASNNNRASTVLDVFLDAVHNYGCPSRVRGDRGGENTMVSVYMIIRKGANRGSFLWGLCVFALNFYYYH